MSTMPNPPLPTLSDTFAPPANVPTNPHLYVVLLLAYKGADGDMVTVPSIAPTEEQALAGAREANLLQHPEPDWTGHREFPFLIPDQLILQTAGILHKAAGPHAMDFFSPPDPQSPAYDPFQLPSQVEVVGMSSPDPDPFSSDLSTAFAKNPHVKTPPPPCSTDPVVACHANKVSFCC